MVLWGFVELALAHAIVSGTVRAHVTASSCHVLRHTIVVTRATSYRALTETHWFATVSKLFGRLGTGASNTY